MKRARKHNGLVQTMLEITGNQRACLWTEPLWGIPYNLYVPFVSVYMAALGVSPMQIGLINTLFLISQLVWALLSGVLTDKLGRRLTTFLFDLVCWSVPTLLWMLAQDVRWFAVAVSSEESLLYLLFCLWRSSLISRGKRNSLYAVRVRRALHVLAARAALPGLFPLLRRAAVPRRAVPAVGSVAGAGCASSRAAGDVPSPGQDS